MEIAWQTIFTLIDKNEIEPVVDMCRKMKTDDCRAITKRLVEEMQNTNVTNCRNTIAIILGDLKCDEAIDSIITLLINPNNKNCRGSLIYALEELECHDKIKQLMYLMFEGNWETKYNMYNLMEKKAGSMSELDKSECVNMLERKIEEMENDLMLLEDVRNKIFGKQ